MHIERPIYRWFISAYPNSSSDEGHLGWICTFGLPWFKHGWFGRRALGDVYLHRSGLTLTISRLQLAFIHRGSICAQNRKPLFRFESYGLFVKSIVIPS